MMVSDLYFSDIVGRNASVIRSSNSSNVGISGEVCDETMNTLHLLSGSRRIVIPKSGSVFLVRYEGSEVEIMGESIMFRPEDRIKYRSRIEKNLKRRK